MRTGSSPPRGLRRLLVCLALLLVLAPFALRAEDVIYTTDGSRLRGKIVDESRREVTIETPGGRMVVPRGQISRIERQGDAQKELEARKAKLSSTDAEGWYELGRWCLSQKLDAQAVECWKAVIRIAPDHAAARAELGHRKHDGKWLTEDEYFQSRGFVRWEGRWVTPEDKEKLALGLVKVDGKWVAAAEESEGEPEQEADPDRVRRREEAAARRRAEAEAAKAEAAKAEAARAAEKDDKEEKGEKRASSRKGKPAKFRVMSFNVRFDFESDGSNRWQYRADVVAKTIKQSQATLIGIQEDKADQVQDLEERLPEFAFLGLGRNGGQSGEHNSILYRRDAWRLKENGDFWLSDTPDVQGSNTWGDKYPRKVTWALLEPASSDRPVLFLNTHYPEGNAEHLRVKGSTLTRGWIEKKLGEKGISKVTVIHTGDFNAAAGSEPQTILMRDGLLRDAWVEARPADPSPGTFGDFRGLKGDKRIDWILVGGPARVLSASKMDEQVDGRYPSDHYPVQADIEVR